jgi:hypothetical protein
MLGEADRRRTAYHEAAMRSSACSRAGADPVRKVSIIPRGLALGVTFAAPESDRFNYRLPEIEAKIKVALGGRAAEEVVFGEISTGAESDIQQLTEIARQMVGRWGMSKAIGPVAVIPRDGAGPLLPGVAEVSPQTQKLVDDEVRRIVEEAHQEVIALLETTATSSTPSRRLCSSTRRSTKTTLTPRPASRTSRTSARTLLGRGPLAHRRALGRRFRELLGDAAHACFTLAKAATTSGSNCLPACARISSVARSSSARSGTAGPSVIASIASTSAKMRAATGICSHASPSG